MTDAASSPDRTMQMLDLLAEMDLTAAQHAHAQLLAATEPKAVAELARAYQRTSRSLRQVLMLKMRRDGDAAAAARRAAVEARTSEMLGEPTARERLTDGRIEDLQDAIGRIAAVTHPDNLRLQREALDRLDVELEDWVDDDDFLLERLTTLVDQACERLGLPRRYSDTWEDLPKPLSPFDPATAAKPSPAAPPPIPKADTG